MWDKSRTLLVARLYWLAGILVFVQGALQLHGDRVSDLHLWRVGPGHSALLCSVVSDNPQDPSIYKARLSGLKGLSHVTVEAHTCADHEHLGGLR